MLKKLSIFVLTSVGIYFIIALGLIVSQSPNDVAFNSVSDGDLQFDAAIDADYSGLPELTRYTVRDTAELGYRYYPSAAKTERIIILVHGSSWHGMQFHKMAKAFADKGLGDVVLPDLRGHGPDPVTRGDIAYIEQLEDDMADMIDHLHKTYGAEKEIVLGGHSSGGGFAIRFGSGEHGKLADQLILLAPFLRHDAPTTRANSGNWAHPAVRRIIGLSMLNGIGITGLNHLAIIKFNVSEEISAGNLSDTVTSEYSYALNTGFAPRSDYLSDLERLNQPVLLLVGSDDETFYANQYEPLMSQHVKIGEYKILENVDHIGLVFDDNAILEMAKWVENNN